MQWSECDHVRIVYYSFGVIKERHMALRSAILVSLRVEFCAQLQAALCVLGPPCGERQLWGRRQQAGLVLSQVSKVLITPRRDSKRPRAPDFGHIVVWNSVGIAFGK
mmetsp:Transcript_46748/g.101533  ORF Transcript_46748/g.101533 Transcript_46748/m.101533 type:complete len:107 (-) Transcript_46748:55-375(-)